MAKDGKNWNDSGTLPDTPAVGYVEIPQIWPGFDNDPEHEYPVGGDIGGHGRVVQRVIQRPAEQRDTVAGATDINRSGVAAVALINMAAGAQGSNGRVTGVTGRGMVVDEWLDTSESEYEWAEE